MNINFALINLTKDTFQQYFDTAMTDDDDGDNAPRAGSREYHVRNVPS